MPYSQPYLLSGSVTGGRRQPSLGPIFIAFVLFGSIFLCGVYFFWQRAGHHQAAHQSAAVPRKSQATDTFQDDLTLHVKNAQGHLNITIERLALAQQRLHLLDSALDGRYLPVEQRRLQTAEALCRQATVEATAVLEELRIADAQLQSKEK